LEKEEINSDDIYLLCFTSGTTGVPKGAMITHGNALGVLTAVSHSDINLTTEDVWLSYLPLAHIAEQLFILCIIYGQTRVGFYCGNT